MINKVVQYDNLEFLRALSDEWIDLIYADPPFNTGRDFGEYDDRWGSMDDYIEYMWLRLVECYRILKPTGSLYLHCDTNSNYYLRLLLDDIFGKQNMRNEIVWCYSGPGNVRNAFAKKHDTIYFYRKSDECTFNPVYVPYKSKYAIGSSSSLATGKRTQEELAKLNQMYIKRGKKVEDWWSDIPGGGHLPKKERVGYPTQKPVKLLERIILASSNKGDLVFDPFCGSGTTLVAAKRLERKYIGCDINPDAVKLAKERLLKTDVEQTLF